MMTEPLRATPESTADELSEAGDQTDGRCGSDGRHVVLIDLVAESCIADRVQTHEVVEGIGAPIWEDETRERHGEPAFPERLYGLRCAQQSRACGDHDLLIITRVDRGGDEAVHGSGRGAVQSIREDRINDGALDDAVQRPVRRRRFRRYGRARHRRGSRHRGLCWSRRRGGCECGSSR